jgi:hypothetical protein
LTSGYFRFLLVHAQSQVGRYEFQAEGIGDALVKSRTIRRTSRRDSGAEVVLGAGPL